MVKNQDFYNHKYEQKNRGILVPLKYTTESYVPRFL